MSSEKPTKEDLKAKLKTINIIFYLVMLIWLVFIGVILYKFIRGEETTSLFIGTIPLVAVLILLGQLKSKIRKEIES